MPRLLNNTDRDITLGSGHIVPARDMLLVTEQTLAHPDNIAVQGDISAGRLVVELDDAPRYGATGQTMEAVAEDEEISGDDELPSLTRTDIAKMRKSELVELLEAHGCEGAALEGTADELRDTAVAVIFADL
jgi:hypothetical protein